MKEILISLLPLFNLAVTLVLVALFIAMVKTWVQLMRKNPDKNRTAEVFSVLKSLGILVRKKPLLTMREQPMFGQLVRAFPNHIVLAQVSFQALLDTDNISLGNRFNRKYADFFICTKAFNAIAIIELDDTTHDYKVQQDADRDRLLASAGYPVFRYRSIPDLMQLRKDVTPEALACEQTDQLFTLDIR